MKIGMIGTSIISDQFADALSLVSGFEKEIVYSRSLDKAKEKQKQWGMNKATDDFDDFLASDTDVVYIASPNSLHLQQIKQCLTADKHVICEKPMVIKLDEFDEVYQIADDKGLFLFEAYRHINSPNYALLEEAIQNIGTIRCADLVFSKYSSKYDAYKRGENPNIFNPDFKGGALNDLGVYPIAVAVGLFGKWNAMTYKKICLDNGVDASGTIILEYDDFLCNITFSKVCNSHNLSEISGEKGEILIPKISILQDLSINGEHKNLNIIENDMVYEATRFLNIIQNNDQDEYRQLRNISQLTCKVISDVV